jgi:hypothetical protein
VNLTYRPIKVWPAGWDPQKPPTEGSPFTSTWSSTLDLLQRELSQLRATEASIQLDVKAGSLRVDGGMRADAKVGYPGVILTIVTRKHGTLTYACNRFAGGGRWTSGSGYTPTPGWQNNVRAIALGLEALGLEALLEALGLEALRKVERYGIADRGQQYAGWAELPTGIAMGRAMSVEEAAAFILEHAEQDWSAEVEADPFFALAIFKEAAKKLHPDTGCDPELFKKLIQARELLEANAS